MCLPIQPAEKVLTRLQVTGERTRLLYLSGYKYMVNLKLVSLNFEADRAVSHFRTADQPLYWITVSWLRAAHDSTPDATGVGVALRYFFMIMFRTGNHGLVLFMSYSERASGKCNQL